MTIKLTFLGTAGQIPSVQRNHTAVLLTFKGENILIDCGEGTQRQFRKAGLNPCKVTKILITHIHGDHVFGLPGLLSTLNLSGYNKKLHVYGPRGTRRFMESFLGLSKVKRSFEIKIEEVSGKFFEGKDFYLEAEKMKHGIPTNAYSFIKKGQIRIDKNKMKKAKLSQGPHLLKLKQGKDISFKGKKYKAKNLTFKEEDKKISFVLDTLNNQRILKIAKDSDLFICEASFSDELKEQAKEHLHMTSKQAAEAAKKAKVKKLVLTHLSQRYESNPGLILKEAKKIFKNSILVKDLDVLEI
ncbi:MAG: ribonuclease Z [archaeon]